MYEYRLYQHRLRDCRQACRPNPSRLRRGRDVDGDIRRRGRYDPRRAQCDEMSRKIKAGWRFSVVLNGEIEGTENRQRKHLFSLPICDIMETIKLLGSKYVA